MSCMPSQKRHGFQSWNVPSNISDKAEDKGDKPKDTGDKEDKLGDAGDKGPGHTPKTRQRILAQQHRQTQIKICMVPK